MKNLSLAKKTFIGYGVAGIILIIFSCKVIHFIIFIIIIIYFF